METKMLTLNCLLIGKGEIITVEISNEKNVNILKKAIKTEAPDLITCESHSLTLYMAKQEGKADGQWIGSRSHEKIELSNPDIKENIKNIYLNEEMEMDGTWELNEYFKDDLAKKSIHVLVMLPEQKQESVPGQLEIHPRAERWRKINEILIKNKKYRVDLSSTGYSYTRWNEFDSIFNVEKYTESIKDIPQDDLATLSKVLWWIVRCYRYKLADINDSEQKRLHLIAPILWAVVQLLPDVNIFIEKDLDGVRVNAHGHFEFILVRGKKTIGIVEAKKWEFQQGMCQALLGCEVAADLDDSHEVYGIVTNFEKWIFARSLDNKILIDEYNVLTYECDGIPNQPELKKIVGKLYSLLS